MFDQLKPLIQNGERYIVVENGKPEYVLMRFGDYAALVKGRKDNPEHGTSPLKSPGDWELANTELADGDSRPEAVPSGFTAEPLAPGPDPATIRLEDLPL